MLLNFPKRHPEREHRRLIDFDAALMMEPATLSGTIIGVTCNKVCPPWLITLLLIVFLGITTQRTFRKAFKKWAQESIRQISDGPSSHYHDLGLCLKKSCLPHSKATLCVLKPPARTRTATPHFGPHCHPLHVCSTLHSVRRRPLEARPL